MEVIPAILWEQRYSRNEICERRGVRSGRLGALSRDQVELSDLRPLASGCDQGNATIELIDDLEDRLVPLLGSGMYKQHPADSEMSFDAMGFGNQRVRGFLNTVVQEAVGIPQREHESSSERFVQILVQRLLRAIAHRHQERRLRAVSQASELPEDVLR